MGTGKAEVVGKEQGDKIGTETQECTAGALETAGSTLLTSVPPTAVGEAVAQSPPGCAL